MEIVKQLSIFAANQPGTLAEITGSLSREKIDIRGMTIVDHMDYALIRMVVDKPSEALHFLGNSGLLVVENEILRLELKSGPGALEHVARALGNTGLNIDYLYGSEPSADGSSIMYMMTRDNRRALEAIRNAGL